MLVLDYAPSEYNIAMRDIRIIAHDIRSTHNVGALLRTADGLGVAHIYFTGYTPYPLQARDTRLPHLATKLDRQIHKTALGAEATVQWTHKEDVLSLITQLRQEGFTVVALEQADSSVLLPDFVVPEKVAIVLGREVEGIEPAILAACDVTVEIPMFGSKESFNVVEAATIAMYHCSTAAQ